MSTSSPKQPLFLIIYPSPLFAAHWSLFLPTPPNESLGTRIHVTGSSLSGFTHEFVRSYDLSDESRAYKLLPLPDVDSEFVTDSGVERGSCDQDNGAETTNARPASELERIALEVPAPGKSLKGVDVGGDGVRTRVQLKNCQTWLLEYIKLLVQKGILPQEARAVVEGAPKN